jgi:D-arabinose 1-dehydrogenase-like Zn-dependent alcohol dehydrogenase
MRAAVITEANGPWEIQERTDPRPGDGQVVIRVRACGVCGTDVHVHRGHFPPCPPPCVAGHEPVGEVAQVGPGVTTMKVGDRVGVSWVQKGCGRCRACQQLRPLYCPEYQSWMQLGGGNAELMLAWADGCTLLPDGLAYEKAAPLFCAGSTVVGAIRQAGLRPGERLAVLGVGGLGHLAIQYARALGVEVVALTASEDKLPLAKSLGATDAILIGDHAGQALWRAGGADVVLNTGNSALQLGLVVGGLRPEGRLVNTGVVDGAIHFPDQHVLLQRQLRLVSVLLGERRDLVEALELASRGALDPKIETFALRDATRAIEHVASGKVRFRAVLQM